MKCRVEIATAIMPGTKADESLLPLATTGPAIIHVSGVSAGPKKLPMFLVYVTSILLARKRGLQTVCSTLHQLMLSVACPQAIWSVQNGLGTFFGSQTGGRLSKREVTHGPQSRAERQKRKKKKKKKKGT